MIHLESGAGSAVLERGAEERRAEQQVQKVTDEHTKAIDDLLKVKESEIMEV